jgi:hypothetical protein
VRAAICCSIREGGAITKRQWASPRASVPDPGPIRGGDKAGVDPEVGLHRVTDQHDLARFLTWRLHGDDCPRTFRAAQAVVVPAQYRPTVHQQDPVMGLDPGVFRGRLGENGDHHDLAALEVCLAEDADAHKVILALQLSLRQFHVQRRQEERMLILQFIDCVLHFDVERIGGQPGFDHGLVAGFDLAPVPAIEIRIDIDLLHNIPDISKDFQLVVL